MNGGKEPDRTLECARRAPSWSRSPFRSRSSSNRNVILGEPSCQVPNPNYLDTFTSSSPPAAANSMILLRASLRGLGSALTFSLIALHESALFGKHRHLGSSTRELPPRHVCPFQALGPPCLGELTWSVSGMQDRLHLFYPIVAESWYTTWMDQHHHVITPVVGAHSTSLTLMRSWDARITDP